MLELHCFLKFTPSAHEGRYVLVKDWGNLNVKATYVFSILNIYTCKHKIHSHQAYIYLICLEINNKTKTINLTKILYKQPYSRLASNLFVRNRKSMVVFKIKVLLLSSKELLLYRRISVICKSFLSKMFLLMFHILFRKADLPLE